MSSFQEIRDSLIVGRSAPGDPWGASLDDGPRKRAEGRHPAAQSVRITQIDVETATSLSFRLESVSPNRPLAPFRPGQYLSVREERDGWFLMRPYSISGPSHPASVPPYYQITIRKKPANGFFTDHVWAHWKVGTVLSITAPLGNFYYNPLRDSREILLIAGGSGIAPFLPLLTSLLDREQIVQIRLVYASRVADDIIFKDPLDGLAEVHRERLRVTYVVGSGTDDPRGLRGPLDESILARSAQGMTDPTYFVCGPYGFYGAVQSMLKSLGAKRRRIRCEVFGEDPMPFARYATEGSQFGRAVVVSICSGETCHRATGTAGESLLNMLERSGIRQESACRSGECGVCRCQVLQGEFLSNPDTDQRRSYDRVAGYVYACCTYPLSDIEVRVDAQDPLEL